MKKIFYIVLVIVALMVISRFVKQGNQTVPSEVIAVEEVVPEGAEAAEAVSEEVAVDENGLGVVVEARADVGGVLHAFFGAESGQDAAQSFGPVARAEAFAFARQAYDDVGGIGRESHGCAVQNEKKKNENRVESLLVIRAILTEHPWLRPG